MGESTTCPGWSALLVDQLDWPWRHQARPRLEGLTDAERRWEPVWAWNVGAGGATIDLAVPVPDPAPVTTIAGGWHTWSSACSATAPRAAPAVR